jgi:hypothetical protein
VAGAAAIAGTAGRPSGETAVAVAAAASETVQAIFAARAHQRIHAFNNARSRHQRLLRRKLLRDDPRRRRRSSGSGRSS